MTEITSVRCDKCGKISGPRDCKGWTEVRTMEHLFSFYDTKHYCTDHIVILDEDA